VTISTPHEERRKASRHRVFKGAQISFRGLHAAIDCVVRDYSDTGARLVVESPVGIPDRFDLVRENFPAVACRVIWRRATQVGVEFIP
jgi:hypothetical protein